MNRRLHRAIIALLMFLPFSLVYPQESGISLDIIGITSTDLSQVAIHTSVLDSAGQLVSGLESENFSIGGDLAGLAQVTGVENVTDDDLDFASVLVIDTSSSMADQPLSMAQAAARSYLEALRPDDPVAIVTFSSTVQLVVDYTTDRERLNRAIDNLAYGGKTALYDATLLGIETATEAPLERKAVVILSDGGEYGDVSMYTVATKASAPPPFTVCPSIRSAWAGISTGASWRQSRGNPTPSFMIRRRRMNWAIFIATWHSSSAVSTSSA